MSEPISKFMTLLIKEFSLSLIFFAITGGIFASVLVFPPNTIYLLVEENGLFFAIIFYTLSITVSILAFYAGFSQLNRNAIRKLNKQEAIKIHLQNIMCFMDKRSDSEFELITTLLRNSNNQFKLRLPFHSTIINSYGHFNSSSVKLDTMGKYINIKLTDNFYNDLQLCIKKFGKISHFK